MSPTLRPHRTRRGWRLRSVATAGAILMAAGVTAVTLDSAGAASGAQPAGAAGGGVLANLFEWNWPSVARECRNTLGPAGYTGVQVSPPADSLSRDYTTSDAPIEHPWWEV